MGITLDCGPIKTGVKHLFGGVVQAVMSPSGSIVESLENVNGFLAVNTSSDDLIRTDFKQEGVVLKVLLHIFEEFVLLLGRHPFHNKVPRMEENPAEQSWFGILFVKQDRTYGKVTCIAHKLKGQVQSGATRIGASVNFL
nr:hypothetical protein [Tanacetum cinerariifolium]